MPCQIRATTSVIVANKWKRENIPKIVGLSGRRSSIDETGPGSCKSLQHCRGVRAQAATRSGPLLRNVELWVAVGLLIFREDESCREAITRD